MPRWILVVPAVLAEKRGLLQAIRSSSALTRGNRLEVLGMIFVSALVMVLLLAPAGILSLPLWVAGIQPGGVEPASPYGIAALGVFGLAQTLVASIGPTVFTLVYLVLREQTPHRPR